MLHPADIEPERFRRITRAEYDRLVLQGFFEDERVELLRGMLVERSPQGGRHVYAVTQLNEILTPALLKRAQVRIQAPYAASEDSEPEPDVAVTARGDYIDDHPHEVFLLIEVSDSSLRKDRGVKTEIYAESGVPEYWIVNLAERTVEVRSQPKDGRYTIATTHGPGEELRVPGFPDVVVPISAILPPA